ncbi:MULTISPECIES: LysM peptidoglycan-binding and 3D domain-containing protein [Allobacillus]|uniref:LysM peptidoglycan-binding domain-containing protein n=1 Tax=Allobacillus halotolerans TaxID=570278 RepID=A0ABS6GRS5_9BACI|nr:MULTISPECIES: LysM peptidoglycan-binding and 3D domain-containing protein [Allobacillus]MBU6081810.1 LysM peptidoglycan-binding domain-containing protein [Allobacillus halotolerans]TSJ63448.1 LysM peptidoglycan-binding domain-containing protein [Allobacillus sp. SKP2-8]
MRKTFLSLAGGLIISGAIFSSSVSAEETYQVKQGDYLNQIADKFDTTVSDIMEINNLEDTLIITGETLKVDATRTIEVVKGETLSQIAKDFDVEVEDIKEWNDLDSDLILIGQELEFDIPLEKFNEKVEAREGGQAVQSSNNESAATQSSNQQNAQSSNKQEQKTEKKQKQSTEQTTEKQSTEKQDKVKATNTASQSTSSNQSSNQSQQSSQKEGRTLTVEATAYTADCAGCSGVTATGIDLNNSPNKKVIAVDPNVIPLGSRVYVEGYGEAIAGDTGGAINGNIIDLHVPTKAEAYQWGRRTVEVTILD